MSNSSPSAGCTMGHWWHQGETLLLLTHGRAPVATGYTSQHKSSKKWECSQTIPSQIPHPQLCSEGLSFLFSNTFYFRYFLLHLSWLSMQCMCEHWVIINVSPWSVYVNLAVKSATHSTAWVKELKLWITRELNVNLYVKQRLNFLFFKKVKWFGRKNGYAFFPFIYGCSDIGAIFE